MILVVDRRQVSASFLEGFTMLSPLMSSGLLKPEIKT